MVEDIKEVEGKMKLNRSAIFVCLPMDVSSCQCDNPRSTPLPVRPSEFSVYKDNLKKLVDVNDYLRQKRVSKYYEAEVPTGANRYQQRSNMSLCCEINRN